MNGGILNNIVKIRKAYPSKSIGEIKQCILADAYVITHDLEAFDPAEEFTTGMTQNKRNQALLSLLSNLEQSGANLEIILHNQIVSMKLLSNWIDTVEGISNDCDQYPD